MGHLQSRRDRAVGSHVNSCISQCGFRGEPGPEPHGGVLALVLPDPAQRLGTELREHCLGVPVFKKLPVIPNTPFRPNLRSHFIEEEK